MEGRFYGVLVGLEVDGLPAVGVCHFPALGETFAAAGGLGCHWNGRRARVSTVDRLEDAGIGYSDSRMLGERMGQGWTTLQQAVRVVRGWGDCYGHCLVASGRLDVMLDPAMNPWDCCALVPILQEAGGAFTDWRGAARVDGGDATAPTAASTRSSVATSRRCRGWPESLPICERLSGSSVGMSEAIKRHDGPVPFLTGFAGFYRIQVI